MILHHYPDLIFFEEIPELLDEIVAVVEAQNFGQTTSKVIIPLNFLLEVKFVGMVGIRKGLGIAAHGAAHAGHLRSSLAAAESSPIPSLTLSTATLML